MTAPQQRGASRYRYWTLQHRRFLEQVGGCLVAHPRDNGPMFELAYEFMLDAYRERVVSGDEPTDRLVWAWRDPADVSLEQMLDTADSLVGGHLEELRSSVLIELAPPSDLLLASCYGAFNLLIHFCGAFQRRPRFPRDWDGLFEVADDAEPGTVQVVLPFIDRAWITRVTPVTRTMIGADLD